uniref:DNA-directed DNA polymerase n=2 Tax=Sipha flava TaxID=143950 RepID=A0A2S2Q9M7_9HEMI
MDMVKTPGFTEISSSANRKIVWYYAKNINNVQNYPDFLHSLEPELNQILKTRVQQGAIKFNLKLEATYNRANVPKSSENRAFKTTATEIFMHTDIDSIVEQAFVKLLAEEDAYVYRGSGFTLEAIDGLLLGIYNYTPMAGSSYIELPAYIDRKRATINPQNNDQQCFKWAILAKHVTEQPKYRIGENYRQHEGKYNFDGISFPTPLSDISKFEKYNPNVTVNVYGLDKKFQPPRKYPTYEVYPLRVSDEEKANHFDLLSVTDDENSHYIYIANFSRLIRSQKTHHESQAIFCKRCFTSFHKQNLKHKLSGQAALEHHRLICGPHKPILPKMPEDGTVLEFNAWQNAQRHPIVIYADFEALLVKTDEEKGDNTTIIQKHRPMSYGLIVKASEDVPTELLSEHNIPTEPVIYRGSESQPDVARHFIETVTDISLNIEKLLKTNIPINMFADDIQVHEAATHCNLCKCDVNNYTRIRDHDHLTGKFRQTLCSRCNLSLKQPKYVPVFIHNLTNYDAHFIVTELGYDSHRIKVIPNSEEKFVTFSKYISNNFTFRFVDTFRFMATRLSTLAANLITPNLEKFRITAKHFSNNDLPLVTRKGVYPYDFTDDWAKLEQTTLPAKEDFYSTLTEEYIKETEYQFAEDVWSHFNCQTLGEYSDLYLKIDVLLLADVFENFRDLCLSTYNLDPAYYFTAPAFSFDAMLKYTSIKLDLLSDYEMLLMIENGIRGGLTQASMRYAKPNNERTPDYNPADPKSWLVYQDCNNLYGWAMSQFMPYGGFKWVKPSLNGLADLNATSPIGRFYEVDITYPNNFTINTTACHFYHKIVYHQAQKCRNSWLRLNQKKIMLFIIATSNKS